MRRSGEAEAIDDDGSDEDARTGKLGPAEGAPRGRRKRKDYPIWLKVEPAKRRLPPLPERLSRPTWARLSRQIAAFLRSRLNNSLTLREAVRVTNAEMRLLGAQTEEIAAALRLAVTEHPELATLDRTNVVTRRLASEELIERMLHWLDEAT